MRRNVISLALCTLLILAASPTLLAADSVLTTATRGKLRNFVSRVLEADNKTVAAWVSDPNRGGLDFSGFRPNQVKHLRAFIADVNTYKSSLNSAFSLFSSGMRGAAYHDQHEGNMPFGAADEFYRTTISNPGVSNVPAFGTGGTPDPNDIFTSMNYTYYVAAMLAKAGAASNIFEVMLIDGSYSKAELEQVLRDGIQSARYVYAGAHVNYMKPEIVKARDEIIAAFNEKLARIGKPGVSASSLAASRQPGRRSTAPARQRTRQPKATPTPSEAAQPSATDVKASREQVEAGNRLAGEKRWAEAVEAYRLAAFADPGSAEIQGLLGDAYMNAGRYKEAFAAYQEAIRLAPKDPEAHYKLGAAYIVMGQYGDSFQPFLQALRFDPQYAEAHYGIGHAYVYLEEYEKALGFLRSAVRLAPDFAEAHYDLALVYDALDDADGLRREQSILQTLDPALANELRKALR